METPELEGASADLVEQLNEKVQGLEEALLSRDIIGQAKGVLMERLHLTSDQAFEELRAVSQHQNRKVRDIAAALADTGEWPPAMLDGQRSSGRTTNNGQSAKSA
jgi:AmiR/NasT family two-component response regulator